MQISSQRVSAWQIRIALDLPNEAIPALDAYCRTEEGRGRLAALVTLADAKRDFEEVVRLSSADARRQARGLLQLGRICVKLSDSSEAKRNLQIALEIDRQTNVFTEEERSEIGNIIGQSGG